MGVYFKGMKMPENCLNCDVNTSYNYCPVLCRDTSNIRYDKRFDDCPAVEVKEPHGRLIDADDFFERLGEKDISFSLFFDGMFVDISVITELLSNLKTVIEAEGGK